MSTDFYLDNIDLDNGAKTLTAVCVPNGYTGGPKINIILFLHGTGQTSAQDYLTQKDHDLRDKLDNSPVKNLVLIVPTLTSDARGGKLGGDDADTVPSGALKWYLPLVSSELQKKSPSPAITDFGIAGNVDKIILAAHSGGGKVMLALSRTKGKGDYVDKIVECWGFDCLYGHPAGALSTPTAAPDVKASQEQWTNWETKQKAHREMLWADSLASSGVDFYLYCATGPKGGGTVTRSTNLDKLAKRRNLANVHITFDGSATHEGILLPRFGSRIDKLTP